ncbi:MAG: choice-of-anchor D domain-containing protein [Deltaproteobacteria bacterium]|nr:choice-of-anchor D domain-containing protein [Deltaproteobacteria bacterium]
MTTFDVAEAGWGDAPLPVHFVWSIKADGGPLTCKLDWDGDGTIDKEISGCRPDTLQDAVADLPTYTFTKTGEHHPKLVVSDGVRTAERTTTVFANFVKYAPGVILPEKTEGFVGAETSWKAPATYGVDPPHVVLTYTDASKVPAIAPGTILWGSAYVMKVTTATPSGKTLAVDGVSVPITDAIQDCFVGARDVVPSFAGARCNADSCKDWVYEPLPPGKSPIAGADAGADGGSPTSFKRLGTHADPLKVDFAGSFFGLKVGLPTLDIDAFEHSFQFGIVVNKFLVEIGGFSLKIAEVDIQPSLKYEFNVKEALRDGKYDFGAAPLGPPIAIGPIPLIPEVAPQLRYKVDVKAGASVEFKAPIKFAYHDGPPSNLGFEFNPLPTAFLGITNWEPTPEAAAGLSGSLSFVPKFRLRIPGIGGPYVAPVISATIEGMAKMKTPSPPGAACSDPDYVPPSGGVFCGAFKLGFGGECDFELTWLEFTKKKLSWKTLEFQIAEIVLEKCKGFCGGTTVDAGSDAADAAPDGDATAGDAVASDTSVGDSSIPDAPAEGGSDSGTLADITADCFEGATVSVCGTSFYPGSTMTLVNVTEVPGGISSYAAVLGKPEVGDESSNVPSSAKVFTFFDTSSLWGVPGFPTPIVGRDVNRGGRSNLIAVWKNSAGVFEWVTNITGGHYSFTGGLPVYRQFQFIHESSSAPTSSPLSSFGARKDFFRSYKSSEGTVWTELDPPTDLSCAPVISFPKDCFQYAELSMAPIAIDLGAVPAGSSSADATFDLSNDGKDPSSAITLSLTGADASLFSISGGSCMSGVTTLAAGGSCAIKMKFNPLSTTSVGTKTATLKATASTGGTVHATVTGKVSSAGLALSPTPKDFGFLLAGASTPDTTFTVTNTGGSPSSAITLSLTGADASQFTLTGGTCASGTTTLAPSASCTVTARFAPGSTAIAGSKSATLSATATTGGTASAALSGVVQAPAALTITPAGKVYGSVSTTGAGTDSLFTVKNGVGGVTSGTLAIAIGGTHPSDFAITGGTCVPGTTKLAGGASCSVIVRFKPTSTGAKSASLGVVATPGGTPAASLTGTGI